MSAADSVHCVFARSHFTVGPVVVVMTAVSYTHLTLPTILRV